MMQNVSFESIKKRITKPLRPGFTINFRLITFMLWFCMPFTNCTSPSEKSRQDQDYATGIISWKNARIERLKSKTGWLNIIGLYWLKEGMNTIGSKPGNDIIFPESAPGYCGTIKLFNDSVFYFPGTDPNIRINSGPAMEMLLENDLSGNPTLIEADRYAWFVIRRGDRFGIRLRDYEHPEVKELTHIPSYPVSQKWKVTARLIPFDTVRIVEVATVDGGKELYSCPGRLIFRLGREKCELLPFTENDRFFIIFGDRTNGKETYGAGRFLYSDIQDAENRVILDFNMSYNPPCAFTPFATCPMPPYENLLDIEIKAGEKEVHIQ
jgi:uncharacterized protein (DUF1684 family)